MSDIDKSESEQKVDKYRKIGIILLALGFVNKKIFNYNSIYFLSFLYNIPLHL